jgi:hypothetical protein
MSNPWIDALKKWNSEKGGPWCVPRKGSSQYDAVRQLMPLKKSQVSVPIKSKKVQEMVKRQKEEELESNRKKALTQLRQIEEETKARNEARKAVVPPPQKRKRPAVAPQAIPIESAVSQKYKTAEDLPPDIVNQILNTAGFPGLAMKQGKKAPLNVSELFSLGKNLYKSRANAIVLLLSAISAGKDGNEKMLFVARANEIPLERTRNYNDKVKAIINLFYPKLSSDNLRFLHLYGYESGFDFTIEALTEAQVQLLQKMFNNKLEIESYRRKGTLGNKSGVIIKWNPDTTGINKRTKEGKAEINKIYEESAKLASEYLDIIEENATKIMNLSKDVVSKETKDKKEEKEKVKEEAKKDIFIASTRKNAISYSPDMFEKVLEAFSGDKERAIKSAKTIRERYPGKNVFFYGRKNLNIEPDNS